MKSLFWLHIKKSAGITTRQLLHPFYVEVDRTKKPPNFIQSDPREWNDILNHFRVVLGEYQFKRALFAKKFLYPHEWDNIVSFAFCRNPIDRCVSMFHYLYWRGGAYQFLQELKNAIRFSMKPNGNPRWATVHLSESHAFSEFLDLVAEAQARDSIYHPHGLHFKTHTAAMWDDITDFKGNILLHKVYRLDDLVAGINDVFARCGIDKRLDGNVVHLNQTKRKTAFTPKPYHFKKMQKVFAKDLELYESIQGI